MDLVIAKPYCCMPASLEMILRHYGYTDISQHDIAEYFGIFAPPETGGLGEIQNILFTDDKSLYGICFESKRLSEYFSDSSISLLEEFTSVRQFYDEYHFQQKVSQALHSGGSVICGYNYSTLFGNSTDMIGHVSIILSFCDPVVQILDPGPKNPGLKNVDIEKLFFSMRSKYGGIWVIRPLT